MSFIRRLIGIPDTSPTTGATTPRPSAGAPPDAETATVRRIVAHLESLPPERARELAAASYVLCRVANADFEISAEETSAMEKTLASHAGVSEAEAVIVVELAKQQARLFGATEDYLVTREYLRISTPDQRLALLRACFLAAAADDTITAEESATLDQVARELQVPDPDLAALRAEFGEQLSVVQAIRRARGV